MIAVLVGFLRFYQLVLFARIILSWIGLGGGPFGALLRDATDPLLRFVRRVVPPDILNLGILDLTPLFGFLLIDLAILLIGGYA